LLLLLFIFVCKNVFFVAINVHTGEEVAIKLEHMNAKHPQLHIECKFYKIMQDGGTFVCLKNIRNMLLQNLFDLQLVFQQSSIMVLKVNTL
jgi:hypothetical protein